MKRTYRNFTILFAALILSATVGCGSDPETPLPTETTDIPAVSETVTETEAPSYIDLLPAEVSFPDTNFHIGYVAVPDYSTMNECAFTLEEAQGDIINEAIYQRNLQTSEKLGVSITAEQMCNSWADMQTTLARLVKSGDCPYDTVIGPVVWQFRSSLTDMLIDMNTLDSIDFSHAWWDTDVIKNMYSLGTNNIYFASGDINYHDDYGQHCLIFNKKLCDTYDLAYPYQLVLDGKWTYDKLKEYCMNFGLDLNGDSRMDQNDLFGYIGNTGALNNVFLPSAGENVITVNDDLTVTLNASDRLYSVVNSFFTDFENRDVYCIMERELGYDIGNTVFPTGHALFCGNAMVHLIADYRVSMEDDFGILPHPKFDESQKNYYSMLNQVYATAYSIPITNENPEQTGWILDVMGYYSQDTLYPAVIEKNIKTKAMRDEESIAMLDILFDSKFYELGGWGTKIYENINTLVMKGENTYSSTLEKTEKTTQNEFKELPNAYRK